MQTRLSDPCHSIQRRLIRLLAAVLITGMAGCVSTAPQIDSDITPQVSGGSGVVTHTQAEKTMDKISDQTEDPVAFGELLSIIGSLSSTPLFKDNRTHLLVDGPATYKAMFEAIDGAQHFIHLETYIFADDEVGVKLAEKLIERQRNGVKVRIIYDSIGSFESSADFFETMRETGIELIEFHKINPIDGGNPLNANVRDHRKLLVVDGEVAFTGGINFSSTYSSISGGKPKFDRLKEGWRDTHIAVWGPAVAGFEEIFEANWLGQGGAAEDFPLTLPEPTHEGQDVIAVLHSVGGDGQESPIYHAYLETMDVAQEKIWITQAYFAPDKSFLEKLAQAADRGVDVRVMVPGFSDSNLVLNASRSRYGYLLKHGVKIYESTLSVLHAKTAVIDGIWSTVGSSNLDYRSFLHNDELNAIIFGQSFAAQMEAQFLVDMNSCEAVSLEEWKKRPIGDRIKEFFSWTIQYWL